MIRGQLLLLLALYVLGLIAVYIVRMGLLPSGAGAPAEMTMQKDPLQSVAASSAAAAASPPSQVVVGEVRKQEEMTKKEKKKEEVEEIEVAEWNSLGWVKNATLIRDYKRLQAAFWNSPNRALFRPQPLIYRPLLPSFGWGNLFYDICHNFLLAVILERPFIMSFDLKDPTGAMDALLEPKEIDWRYSSLLSHRHEVNSSTLFSEFSQHQHILQPHLAGRIKTMHPDFDLNFLQKTMSSPLHEQVSCRQSHRWYDLCGRSSSRGSLDAIYPLLRAMPEKILYSEYSESIIMPIRNSKGWIEWVNKNLFQKRQMWDDLAIACRFVFNFLFRPSRVLRDSLISFQGQIGPHYIVSHIRTGHMEDGGQRSEKQPLQEMVDSLAACKKASGNKKWLLLTDDVGLAAAAKAQNISEITIQAADLNMQVASSMHTGKAHTVFNLEKAPKAAVDAAFKAWKHALTDWLLIVQAPSIIFLRNRMSSAGSFGTRAAYAGGHACVGTKGWNSKRMPNSPSTELSR